MKRQSKQTSDSDPSTDRLIRMFQSETAEVRERRLPFRARASLLVLIAMFASFVALSACVRIDRVVTSSQGQLVTVDPNIVIQPLDASIIKTIDVREGDLVKGGTQLASWDPTLAAADVNALRSQLASYEAEDARCEAELAGGPFDYKSETEPDGIDYGAMERALYAQRKSQFDAQVKTYDEQIATARATIVKLTNSYVETQQRLTIATQVEKMWSNLETKDSGSLLQTLTARDSTIQMRQTIEFDQDSIEETRHQIEATLATRQAFAQSWFAQTSQELVQARNQYETIKQSLDKALKHQELVVIRAPDDAIVLQIEKRSVGSVLQPGETFMELALLKSPVEAEILIDPLQIGFVRPGDYAVIKLDAYNFVEHGTVEGRLRWVSQGTFSQLPSGTGGSLPSSLSTAGPDSANVPATSSSAASSPFYLGRLEITKVDLQDVPADFRLLPGTTLAADIRVGSRSLFWYLARGLVRGFHEAMREP